MSKASDYKKTVEETERPLRRAEGMKPVFTLPGQGNVTAQSESGNLFFRSRGATSTGTGAIIHSDGYVVTNYHVIRGASRIQITTDDGRVYRASVEGTDPITDLAVLRIDGEGPFPALPFAAPSSFRVGDWAIAIGNALGLPGGPSVTLGVVGALDRTLTTREQTLTDLIQTDAAINEGNSGGPLVDLNGEIIGINTAVVRGAQGIGFSVSSFTVIPVVQSILKHGRVTAGAPSSWTTWRPAGTRPGPGRGTPRRGGDGGQRHERRRRAAAGLLRGCPGPGVQPPAWMQASLRRGLGPLAHVEEHALAA